MNTSRILLMSIAVSICNSIIAMAEPTDTIRLNDGKPLVSIYYFAHWWEPWKSNDEAFINDMKDLTGMGYNTILVDHQYSQMLDGNWKYLDREHKIAKQTGMGIIPWLSSGVFGMGSGSAIRDSVEKAYGIIFDMGIGADGSPNDVKPYDPAVMEYGVKYASEYLDRYLENGAILRVMQDGKLKPVVALSVEAKWQGSFDTVTEQMLRSWLRAKYSDDIGKLNRKWHTSFADFSEINMHDKKVFDLDGYFTGTAEHKQAAEDFTEFRSQTADNSLAEIKRRLKEKYPDLLIAAELPYQFYGQHPHAEKYRIDYGANPSVVRHADIVILRASDSLTPKEEKALLAVKKKTGQKIVITYRFSGSYWGPKLREDDSEFDRINTIFAKQAARIADGFGIYSWNEMVDPHVVPDPNPPFNTYMEPTTEDDFIVSQKALRQMAETYIAAELDKSGTGR